jgi:transcriptional regulator with XRE-family HTH domain
MLSELSDRVQTARKRAGYTQRQLAERAGICHVSLWKLEEGITLAPRLDTILSICVALNLSPEYLILGKTPDQMHALGMVSLHCCRCGSTSAQGEGYRRNPTPRTSPAVLTRT